MLLRRRPSLLLRGHTPNQLITKGSAPLSTREQHHQLLNDPEVVAAWRRCASFNVRDSVVDRHVTRIVHCANAKRESYDLLAQKPALVTLHQAADPADLKRLADEEEEETCALVLGGDAVAFAKAWLEGTRSWDWALECSSVLFGVAADQMPSLLKAFKDTRWYANKVDFDEVLGPGMRPSRPFRCVEVFGAPALGSVTSEILSEQQQTGTGPDEELELEKKAAMVREEEKEKSVDKKPSYRGRARK